MLLLRTIGLLLSVRFIRMQCVSTVVRDGIAVPLFTDAIGEYRQNPFRTDTFVRPRVRPYSSAYPIHNAVMLDIFSAIESKADKSESDLRDFALLLMMYRTGWRVEDVLSLTWGQLQIQDFGGFVCTWRGEDGKDTRRALPAPCYHAIVAYLKAAGRYVDSQSSSMSDDEYLWIPLKLHGIHNFANVDVRTLPRNRPIRSSTATGDFPPPSCPFLYSPCESPGTPEFR